MVISLKYCPMQSHHTVLDLDIKGDSRITANFSIKVSPEVIEVGKTN